MVYAYVTLCNKDIWIQRYHQILLLMLLLKESGTEKNTITWVSQAVLQDIVGYNNTSMVSARSCWRQKSYFRRQQSLVDALLQIRRVIRPPRRRHWYINGSALGFWHEKLPGPTQEKLHLGHETNLGDWSKWITTLYDANTSIILNEFT